MNICATSRENLAVRRGAAGTDSEMGRLADNLDRGNRRAAGGAGGADGVGAVGPHAAEHAALFEELRLRPANDLKAELLGLNLDAKGRKPDLARRLADHRIRQTHGRGGGTEHGGEGEGEGEEGAIKIETVPAQQAAEAEAEATGGRPAAPPLTKFAGLADLSAAAGTALARAGFTSASPIQSAAVPAIARRQDCLLHAETGSGKTLAFLLPVTEQIWKEREAGAGTHPIKDGVGYALILLPTRELAAQVAGVATVLAPPGSVRLISHPTNLLGHGAAERGEARFGGRPTDDTHIDENAPPRIIVGSAKAIMTSLFGNKKMPAPPTSKPEAKAFLGSVRWLVMDEVDRLLNVKKSRSERAYKKHEKPAAVLAAAVVRHTLGKAQVVAASATVGRPLKRELSRTLGLPAQECPRVIRGDAGGGEGGGGADAAFADQPPPSPRFGDITGKGDAFGAHIGRAVSIPSTVQNYVVPSMGDSTGQLVTTAAMVAMKLSPRTSDSRGRRTLVVLSKGCDMSVRNALGAMQHFGCRPKPRALIDVLEADGTDRLIEVHRRVTGSTGIGESSREEGGSRDEEDSDGGGYLLLTGEDSVRGLHLDGLDTVICVGRPRGPDEYTHIAGRTGRAGNRGMVINVVSYEQAAALTSWEKMLGVDFVPVDEDEIPSLK